MTHYLDILVCEARIGGQLHDRMMTALHRLVASGHDLQVDWPDWRQNEKRLGLVFRAFGLPGELALLRDAVMPLAEAQLVSPQKVARVPEASEIDGWVQLQRMHTREARMSPSRLRRLQRRARERGEAEPTITLDKPPISQRQYPCLTLQSASSQTTFVMPVSRRRCQPGDAPVDTGRSYGLGRPVPEFFE